MQRDQGQGRNHGAQIPQARRGLQQHDQRHVGDRRTREPRQHLGLQAQQPQRQDQQQEVGAIECPLPLDGDPLGRHEQIHEVERLRDLQYRAGIHLGR